MMEVKIASYNCCSIRKRIDPVRDILKSNDILLCQEIILLEEDCDILHQIDEEFDVFYVPSKPPDSLGDGRPVSGLASFVRKSSNFKVNPIYKTDNFLILSVQICSYKFCIANVYMPSDDKSHESLAFYQSVLGELQGFLDELACNNIILFGDFNTAHNARRRFWPDLEQFIASNTLTMNDLTLPDDTFTYFNSGHSTTSWIDHVISSSNMNIDNITVHYEAAVYDHFPVSFQLKLPVSLSNDNNNIFTNKEQVKRCINWELFKKEMYVRKYNDNFLRLMENNRLCIDSNCRFQHDSDLDTFYKNLIEAFMCASSFAQKKSVKKFQPIPGWNDFCRDKFKIARESFLKWVVEGKPREGPSYNEMNETRKSFRYSLKYCKYNEEQIKIQKLTSDVLKNRPKMFWQEVKSRTGKLHSRISDCIDDLKKPQEIADRFAVKFRAINGVQSNTCPFQYSESNNDFEELLELSTIRSAIDKLNHGIDCDGLYANHFKYLNDESKNVLMNFFNACFLNNHFPAAMMRGVIRPRPKDKFGNLNDSSNYREVMQSPFILKLLEYILLPYVTEHCKISRTQYGYRPNTSSLLAVSTLKEVIGNYVEDGSTIYACFLDMSKAFERINHSLLLQKLQNSTLPKFVINAIHSILSNGRVKVSCHGTESDEWNLLKGARQGGVLSAHLFSIYIDEILKELLKEDYGCYLGLTKMNSQAYADDFVIFCPTSGGLRKLLEKFGILAKKLNLEINVGKTKVVIFHKKRVCHNDVNFEFNGHKIEIVPRYKYLGTILSFNLKENDDISRLQSSFNRKIGMTLRKFHAASIDIKMRLFNSLCMDMYGMELWGDTRGCSHLLDKLAVSYHYALKRIIGLSKRDSNHYACFLLDQLTFEHLRNYRSLKFYRWLYNCKSPCIVATRIYWINCSRLKQRLDHVFLDKYDIDDVIHNDMDAVMSRMKYVQNREPSSWQPVESYF